MTDELPLATSDWRDHCAGFREAYTEMLDARYGRNMAVKEFTESELLRLAQRLQEAEEAGYVMRKAWMCDRGHRHDREIGAKACYILDRVRYILRI